MATLLYTPGVKVIIFASSTQQYIDVSQDVKGGNLTLNADNPHSLTLNMSNYQGKYSNLFTPNDRVIVQMKRVTWLQVFAGYLDQVPLFQVFPNPIQLQATCSLKRIKFHYWDPGFEPTIQAVQSWFSGGQPNGSTDQTDAGMQNVLKQTLNQIIGWDMSKIHIGGLPTNLVSVLAPLWTAVAAEVTSGQANSATGAAGAGTTAAGQNVGAGTAWTAQDWVITMLNYAGVPSSSNNVTNVLHWMAAENPASNWWNRNNPLNASLGTSASDGTASYPDLNTAAKETAAMIQQQNMNLIYKALQNNVSLEDFANALIQAPWADLVLPNGTVTHYGDNPANITTTSINPTQVAPASATGQTVASNSNFISTGASQDQTTTATAGAASADTQQGVNQGVATSTQQAPGGVLAAQFAVAQVGKPYVWGGTGAGGGGYDCSGLTSAAWSAAGQNISRTSESQYANPNIVLVDISQALPGDLLFAAIAGDTGGNPTHVAMIASAGTVVEAADPQIGIHTVGLTDWLKGVTTGGNFFMGVGRVTTGGQGGNKSGGAVTLSGTQITNAGSAGVAGLGTDAGGNVVYGHGEWIPGATANDGISGSLTPLKAMMLDEPMLPFIAEVTAASLRSYCSAPNGDFIAWFPDYFGVYGYAGIWNLSLIELIDFNIQWNDNSLVTHQFVAGSYNTSNSSLDPTAGGQNTDYLTTYGVATIDLPGLIQSVLNIDPTDGGVLATADKIYAQFGARPAFSSQPTIGSSQTAEFWYAIRLFMKAWASQFSASIPLTFMPELWPGMLLRIPDLGFQCYVESVSHTWGMGEGQGFQTQVGVIAPSAVDGSGLIGLPRSGPGAP